MKLILRRLLIPALCCLAPLGAGEVLAQTIVTHTETILNSEGILSELRQDVILIRSEASPLPVSYTRGKATAYVDEKGLPIAIDTVNPGQPVTIYYIQTGNRLDASKVIVRKAAVLSPLRTK